MKPFRYDDYRKTLALAHAGWWATAVIVGLRATEAIPQPVGSLALLTLGAGITSSLALSRYRLSETVAEVFRVGALMGGSNPATPLPSTRADELLSHYAECEVCRLANPNSCEKSAELIRLTLEERHGKVEV